MPNEPTTNIHQKAEADVVRDLAYRATTPKVLSAGTYSVLVRADGEVEYIDTEHLLSHPTRKRGTVDLHDADSFVAFVNRHRGDASTTVYADVFRFGFTAVLNDAQGAGGPAEWADHRATLTLRQTEEWARWSDKDGAMFNQFVEEGIEQIHKPTAAEMLELATTFHATTSATFRQATVLTSGERKLNYDESIEGRGGRSGEMPVPATFELALQPFEGSPNYKVEARLRYRVSGGKLSIGYKLIRPRDVQRDAFQGRADEDRDDNRRPDLRRHSGARGCRVSDLELLPVGAVDVHPHNPRKDVGDLAELVASIRSVGVLQPITVHKKGKRFVCLLGHRRLAAAKAAGLEVIPAVTWNGLSEADQVALMLVENLQREDLNPIDEADALGELAATMKQEEIAAKVGRSQSYISRRLRLLELDDDTKASVASGKTSAAAALRTLEPKKERPSKASEPTAESQPEVDSQSDELEHLIEQTLADRLHELYGDAAPIVLEVYSLLHDAVFAIDDGRLPAAAAAIGDANRRLFNLAGQEPARICGRCHERPAIGGDEPEAPLCEVCASEFKAMVDSAHAEAVAEDPSLADDHPGAHAIADAVHEFRDEIFEDGDDPELEERIAARLGTEQLDPSLLIDDDEAREMIDNLSDEAVAEIFRDVDALDDDDFEPAETMATITQLRASTDPVSQLAAGIAEAVQEGVGEPEGPSAVRITIGVPEGMFRTREVNCSTCGRLTRATEIEFARSKARTHSGRVHGGQAEIIELESVAAAE